MIADIETVRKHLGVQAWVIFGISWGSTLALAYAQSHPDRVRALVLVAVTTTSRGEITWITQGVGRIFPEAFQQFEADARRQPKERIDDAYARQLVHGSYEERLRAAASWQAWETAIVSLDPGPVPVNHSEAFGLNFATLVAHYWANDAFLPDESAILRRISSIAHLPSVLIHGRRDLSGPPVTAWRLHQNCPASRLCIVATEGHGGPQCMLEAGRALDAFARDPGKS